MTDLAKYRLELAAERVEVAEIMVADGRFRIPITNILARLFRQDNIAITEILLSCHVSRQRNNINTRSSSLRQSRLIWGL